MIEKVKVSKRSPRMSIRVYESGEIRISAALSRRMGLKHGDRVALFRSTRHTGYPELYIGKNDNGDCEVYKRNDRGHECRVNMKEYAGILLNGTGRKGLFPVGEVVKVNGNEYFTIIQRNVIQDVQKAR